MAAESAPSYGGNVVDLPVRNAEKSMMLPPQDDGYTVGADAENFEVTEYTGTVETRNLARTCGVFTELKAREDVIFENANEHDRGCYYRFKVANESVADVVGIIEGLKPRTFTEQTHTIQKVVEDYTSQVDILEAKLAVINETLETAVVAYDDVTKLATRTENAESLATIIDSKIRIIERLTQEKLRVTSDLERIERSKAEQLDRLLYTYFTMTVSEQKLVDMQWVKDSWRQATQQAVYDINNTIQDMSVLLVALLFKLVQFGIYLVIIVFVLKYAWRFAQYVWRTK